MSHAANAKMIRCWASAWQAALVGSWAKNHLQDGSDHVQCLVHCTTSLSQYWVSGIGRYWPVSVIDREFEFYKFFSFLKF